MDRLLARVAAEAGVDVRQAQTVVELLAAGSTIPFIARYRKEATKGLDEVDVTAIRDAWKRVQELEDRRATVLESIEKQGKLDAKLRKRIDACETRSELEDLSVPFRPKRRTRATAAREKGLEPLADLIWEQAAESGTPEMVAKAFAGPKKKVKTADEALAGACDILAERIVAMPEVRGEIRKLFRNESTVHAQPARKRQGEANGPEGDKFKDYYHFDASLTELASHRLHALLRGEREKVLSVSFALDPEQAHRVVQRAVIENPRSIFHDLFERASDDAYDRLLSKQMETEIRQFLKDQADRVAIETFAKNLRSLLLAAPLPDRTVLAIDPGMRTGCKVVVLDPTGRLLEHTTVYPNSPKNDVAGARRTFDVLMARFPISAVAVGSGTGGREAFGFVRNYLEDRGERDVPVVMVNESGASIYSASPVAREEFPDLDLTVRGAISIGRRLQDPLAELVKIEPRSLGVGEYQHDVDQDLLQAKLDEVVESCVNHVGVDVNTASAQLLSRVSGIGPKLAKAIVAHRESHGPFASRKDLLAVKGFGAKTFEQAAGFLRIRGRNPLDDSAIHPEQYEFVEQLSRDLGVALNELVGHPDVVERIDPARYEADQGSYTLAGILEELRKPGRDPREDFDPVPFRDDVQQLGDLEEQMVLEGTVTNVTAFGAFVDVGVHTEGLVHISQLADEFVEDPHAIVKVGDRVRVRVLGVDLERKRIALSMKGLVAVPVHAG